MFLCKKCLDRKVSPYTYETESPTVEFCSECEVKTDHINYEKFKDKFFSVISRNYISINDLPSRAGAYYHAYDEEGVTTIVDIIDSLELNDDLSNRLFGDIDDRFESGPLVIYDDTLEEYEGCQIEIDWDKIQNDLKHNLRYFNSDLKNLLDHIFSFISDSGALKIDIINTISSDTIFYRGRSFDSFENLLNGINVDEYNFERPEECYLEEICKKFGVVPSHLASDQRMTPFGISALYLSTEKIACVAEIRALVGQFVGIAQFSNRNRLNLLNLNKIAEGLYPNHLSEKYREDIDVFIFFKKLIARISKPKLESEKFDYLVSQYFFEYLRVVFEGKIDGIYLKSVQMPTANNIILFPEITENGIDSSKEVIKNPIYFSFNKETRYGFSISRVKSIEIKTEIDLYSHTRFPDPVDWM